MERSAQSRCVMSAQNYALAVTVIEQDVIAVQPLTNAAEMNATK